MIDAFGVDDDVPVETEPSSKKTAKRGGKSSGNDYYQTDLVVITAVKKVAPIDLDPFGACQPIHDSDGGIIGHIPAVGGTVGAEREYRLDRGEDAFKLPWRVRRGALYYANPPYSQTRKAVEKANAEYVSGAHGILLIASRTGSVAFQSAQAPLVCFIDRRLTFIDPVTGKPPVDAKGKPCSAMFDSAAFYYGTDETAFRLAFEPLGKVVRWSSAPAKSDLFDEPTGEVCTHPDARPVVTFGNDKIAMQCPLCLEVFDQSQ